MKVNIVTVACVYQTLDEYGRLGSLVCVCRNSSDGDIAAEGQGWYGGPGRVLEKKAIQVGDDLYPLITDQPWQFKDVEEDRAKQKQEAIKKTLSKLTPEEQQLLKEAWK